MRALGLIKFASAQERGTSMMGAKVAVADWRVLKKKMEMFMSLRLFNLLWCRGKTREIYAMPHGQSAGGFHHCILLL